MEKVKSLKNINRSYHGHMRSLTRAGRERDILAALASGKNTYMRMDRLESSSYDSSWIDEIEGVIYDLGQIISNPRLTTKVEGNIVPVELARKTGAESVQHLASHAQYIKEIDEYGNVIPSKILTMMNEDDIRTYENRFIATFVRRLVLFVEKRYEFISKFAELHDEQILMFKNKSIVDGAEVEIETKIRINHKSDDDMSVKNNEYFERIKQMRQYILYFYTSDFMKKLKTEKDVHNPILQTNIIRKNPLYHHCYEVYRFIERYEHLGVHYKVDEQYSVFTDQELAEINNTLFANYITLKGKDRSQVSKGSVKVYKPKILTSPDDEAFIYGPLYAGPIEFLRTDKPYQDYLDSKVRKDLPLHPTKREKEYYEEEYKVKAENKEDLKQKEALIKRKNKEIAAFNKAAAKIDQEREEARLALLEQEKQIIKKEEDDLLTAARNEIIAASLLEQEKVGKQVMQDEINSVKVVKESHPYQKPVTYDEACLQIWPQLKHKPKKKDKAKVEKEPLVNQSIASEPVLPPTTNNPAPAIESKPAQEQPQVVEYSHPHQEPVTYEEAALQIWPQIANAPEQRVPSKDEEPVVAQEAPAKLAAKAKPAKKVAIKPAPQPVEVKEYSHPHQDPVTYEEATLQIWPQMANAPAYRVPSENEEPEPVVEQVPVMEETPVMEEQPQVVEYSHPYQEPVTYDEAALEIWPQIANAPSLRVAPQEEAQPAPVAKAKPVKKAPAKKAPAKKQPIKAKPVEQVKAEQPVEPAKKEQPKKAPKKVVAKPVPAPQPVKEEPVEAPVQPAIVEEPAKEQKVEAAPKQKAAPKQVKKAPVLQTKKPNKPAPKKPATPKKPVAPAPVKLEKPVEKIPGKFIVKLIGGYYVNTKKLSIYKEDAHIFDDFNEAKAIKKARGGKVIKL